MNTNRRLPRLLLATLSMLAVSSYLGARVSAETPPPASAPATDDRVYNDDANHVRFTYPKGFARKALSLPNIVVMYMDSPPTPAARHVHLDIVKAGVVLKPSDLDTIRKGVRDQVTSTGAKIIEDVDSTLGGSPGFSVVFDSGEIRLITIVTVHDGWTYVISGGAVPAEFDAMRKLIQASADSLEFTDATPAK